MKKKFEHLETVCKLGEGAETCKYLGLDNHDLIQCVKLIPKIKEHIDSSNFKAQGDNCDGIEQLESVRKFN